LTTTFRQLRRAALIQRIVLASPSHGEKGATRAYEGQDAEAKASKRLSELRALRGPRGRYELRVRVVLEDGSDFVVHPVWDPERARSLRQLVGQALAVRVEHAQSEQACVEDHRVLELVEGCSLRYLRGPSTPRHLLEAIRSKDTPSRRRAWMEPCRECGLVVGTDPADHRRRHRHFLEDGNLCHPMHGPEPAPDSSPRRSTRDTSSRVGGMGRGHLRGGRSWFVPSRLAIFAPRLHPARDGTEASTARSRQPPTRTLRFPSSQRPDARPRAWRRGARDSTETRP
jgi:hypothetical protein